MNARLETSVLYLITDARRSLGRPTTAIVAAACRGGVDIVQFRPKNLGDAAILSEARRLREITTALGVLLLVNSRIDIALAAEADGIHTGAGRVSPSEARNALGPAAIVGWSAHDPLEALAAEEAGADFVTFSPAFPTHSDSLPRAPLGPSAIAELASRLRIPVFALGGVFAGNIAELARAGVRRVAVVSAVTEAADPESAARQLKAALEDK